MACYASLRAWRTAVNGSREEAIRTGKANRPAVPVPTPERVELLHVSMDGQPVKDQGDPPLTKRSHGNLAGAVLVLNQNSLNGRGRFTSQKELRTAWLSQLAAWPCHRCRWDIGVKTLANSPEELIRSAGRVTVGFGRMVTRLAARPPATLWPRCGSAEQEPNSCRCRRAKILRASPSIQTKRRSIE